MLLKFKTLLLLFGVFMVSNVSTYSQCPDFVDEACLSKFGEFVYDGNRHVTSMKEGENAELFKTFFAGQTYRVVICKSEKLPPIHIRVIANDGSILFDNKDHNFELVWDFAVKGTQKLIVRLDVLKEAEEESEKLNEGCVAILFGVDKEK